MNNILIREITKTDFKEVGEMIQRTHIHSFGEIYHQTLIDEFCKKYTEEGMAKKAEETDYFIAEDTDKQKIVGIIGLRNNELRTFFVDPDYQGQGVGRRLYDRLEQEAIKRGVKELVLEGSPLGEPVYNKFGFKKIKTVEKERAGIKYIDALMVKELD